MAKFIREDIDRLFEFGVNVATRTVHITGEIDLETTTKALRGLDLLSSGYHPTNPITIRLCSEGGDVELGMAIYDAIKSCPCHVTIIASGACQSIAVAILQAADRRVVTKECLLMVHDGEQPVGTINPNSIDSHKLVADFQRNQYYTILSERSTKKHAEWKSLCEKDFWMSSQTALHFKLVDEIA
jgi:ATP-dependent Clp protease protease subunit